MKRIIRISTIAVIALILSMGTSAQNNPVTSSLPSSTTRQTFPLPLPLIDGTLPSSITLAAATSSVSLLNPSPLDPTDLYNIETEDRTALFARGNEGGGNPQKMPVSEGYFLMIVLVIGYGITQRIRGN
jgi:hypothetical protein